MSHTQAPLANDQPRWWLRSLSDETRARLLAREQAEDEGAKGRAMRTSTKRVNVSRGQGAES